MSLSTVLAAACVDVTQPVESSAVHSAAEVAPAACVARSLKGRLLGLAASAPYLERQLSVGDTVRLAPRPVPANTSEPATGWRIGNSEIIRTEGDLVIALAPGRTWVTFGTAGSALCVGLTAISAGVSLTGLEIDASPTAPASASGTQLDATLRFSNGTNLRVREAVTWSSLDPLVVAVSSSGRLEVRQAGAARIVATAGALADTASLQATTQTFEALQPVRAEDFVSSIGVNIHLSYFDRVYGSHFRSIVVPRLQELGVRHLRDGGTTLPNEDWMREVYGRWRETAEATGARFTIIMSPRRTATGPGTNYADMSHVTELRTRIGDEHIAAWEGVNEHDLSGRPAFPAEVRSLQQALYAKVKQDPVSAARHVVVGPSIANVSTAPQVGDLSAFMDAGAVHPYDGGKVPSTNLRQHVDGMRPVNGSKSVWATEVGYHTASTSTNPWHWALTETAQAKYTTRQFLELFNAGVQRSFAYELIDQGLDTSDMEQRFGLLRNDGTRKPAFIALRNLIALLSDRGAPPFVPRSLNLRITGDTTGLRRLVLEKADGRRYLVFWQNSVSYDEVHRRDVPVAPHTIAVTFDTPMTAASIYVPLIDAGVSSVQHNVRTITVSVPDHPIVIELVR